MEILADETQRGWYKILLLEVPTFITEMLNPQYTTQYTLMSFIYGKLDEEVAFDNKLSVPLVSIGAPTFVAKDTSQRLMLIPISELAPEHEKRIYIPAGLIAGIIPIEAQSQIISILVNGMSPVIRPVPDATGKMSDASGKIIDLSKDLRK